MKKFVYAGVIAILILIGIFAWPNKAKAPEQAKLEQSQSNLPNYPTKTVTISGEKFTIMLPKKGQEQHLGLGAVSKLPQNYGMMFTGDGSIGIWMKGMSYPIDIIWLDESDAVIHIVENAEPSSYPKTTFINPSPTIAKSVIELNTGEAKRLGLQIGSKIN